MAAPADPGGHRRAAPSGADAVPMAGLGGRGLGLALAAIADSLLALVFTIAFARALGPEGYSSLAALVSVFLIGSVAGAALQVSIARRIGSEGVARRWPVGASAEGWTRRLGVAAAAALAVCALGRIPLAAAIGVDESWAAALVLPAVLLDLVLATQRGVLLGLGDHRAVAVSMVTTPAGWLVFGGALAAGGLGVTGVIAGIALAELLNAAVLRAVLHRRAQDSGEPGRPLPLGTLVRSAWAPIVAFGLFAALQNLDVVVVNRVAEDVTASSYAAAAVAAKAILWVAMGLGLALVPEAARRHSAGQRSRALLGRSLALTAATAGGMVALYVLAGAPLLAAVFGAELARAADALPVLAVATSLLALAYLGMQLLLAHGRHGFLVGLGAAVVLEVVLVAIAAPRPGAVAAALVGLGLVVAGGLLAAALRSGARPRPATAKP